MLYESMVNIQSTKGFPSLTTMIKREDYESMRASLEEDDSLSETEASEDAQARALFAPF